MLIEDQRHRGGYLRATWHPEQRAVVISHWHDDICTASTTLSVGDLSKLISLLVSALTDAASMGSGDASGEARGNYAGPGGPLAGLRSRLLRTARRWLPVLRPGRRPPAQPGEATPAAGPSSTPTSQREAG